MDRCYHKGGNSLKSGLLMKLSKSKIKELGWLNEAGEFIHTLTEKQLNANRIFKASDDWYCFYKGGSPFYSEPLSRWTDITESINEMDVIETFSKGLSHSKRGTLDFSENFEDEIFYPSDFRYTKHETKESREKFIQSIREEWKYIRYDLVRFRLYIGPPSITLSLFKNGLIDIQTNEEVSAKFLNDWLKKLGLLESDVIMEEIPLKLREKQMHPLSNLHILVNYIENNPKELPENIQEIVTDELINELTIVAEKYKNTKVYK